ncbi:hypothetical protein AAZX31_12G000200 [Glycine max]
MSDLGNLSLSAALKLSHYSSDDALDAPVKTLTNGFDSEPAFETWVLKRTHGSLDRGECRFCCHFIYIGDDELLCSVRGCDTRYHSECAKEAVGPSTLKKFKVSTTCRFLKKLFRCVRCKIAFHSKCAPWSDSVLQLKDHLGHAVCWRHPSDWRLDRKPDASTSDISEVFCRLPLAFMSEEFKIDFTWKDMDNIYLVKKKHSDMDDGAGCTSCSSTCRCSENCNNRPFRKEKNVKIFKV